MQYHQSRSRPCRAAATCPSTGPAWPLLGPVDPAESSGLSSVSPSWWGSLSQRFSHRDRIILVLRGPIERLRLRVGLAREDDDMGRAAFPRDALKVPHEPRCDTEAPRFIFDKELRQLGVWRWIQRVRHPEARESGETPRDLSDHDSLVCIGSHEAA